MSVSATEREFTRGEVMDDVEHDPLTERSLVQRAAEEYRRQGLAVCRLKATGDKRPVEVGWPTRSAKPEEFRSDENVGLVTGWLSDGGKEGQFLVCVDLDTEEAITKADQFLPPTGAIEGRDSKPRSHWWYFVTGVPEWATSTADQAAAAAVAAGKPAGPFKKAFNDAKTGKRVIDFQGTGGQMVVPPSLHQGSGEYRRWEEGCSVEQLTTVTFTELWNAVCRLAEASGVNVPQFGSATASAQSVEPEEPDEESNPDTEGTAESVVLATRVGNTRTGTVTVPMEERVRRCQRYLKSVELARSGRGGHDTTWRVARLIVNDFGIDEPDTAMDLLRQYNAWLKDGGEEEWSEAELKHKLDDALNAPSDPNTFGSKLAEQVDDTPRVWDDPVRLAEGFLRERTVKFVKQTAFEYRDGIHHVVSGEWVTTLVRGYIERAAVQEWRRLRRERETRRRELQTALDNVPPSGASAESYTAFAASQKAARVELSKLNKAGSTAPKVNDGLVRNTISAIAVRAQLPDKTELDSWIGSSSGPAVLAVANGLLDPVGRTLLPHSPDWFATAQLPVAHDSGAPAPTKWLAFLNDVMEGDTERIAILQELFGASLDRSYPAKWFAALVGTGDNGKSVWLAVLRFLLGGANCSAVNLDELSNNRFAAFALFGKLANVVGDQGHFESSDEGRLKTLTGGDLVTFEQKGRDSFVAVNRAKLLFACNTMPTFADKSEAIWNRMVAVPFEYTVPADKKNPELLTAAHWADELPGILNWALDGLARLRAHGGRFTRSAKCEVSKKQTRTDSNPARLFLLEEYEYTGNDADKVTVGDLYSAYQKWCAESGFIRLLTKPKFGKEVRSAFPALLESKVVRDGDATHRYWIGLKLVGVSTAA